MSESNFDLEKIDRKLSLSTRKREVWGWVAQQAIGYAFYAVDTKEELFLKGSTIRYSSVLGHLNALEEIKLIARQERPTLRNPRQAPFEKLANGLWAPINELLIVHGVEGLN